MPTWQRTETRVVRPFESADACLAGVSLRLSRDADFDQRTSFDPSEVELRDISPEFRLAVEPSALKASRLPDASELSLVIRLADARLRRSELVFESGLDNLPQTWAVPPHVTQRFSWKFGVDATVALVLRSGQLPRPGQPFMRGHWVARKDFSVRCRAEPHVFLIERWTAEDFARHGLARDGAYWIQFITDDLNTRFDEPGQAFRVCLRADVYDTLVQAQETPQARALFSTIAAEILSEVLWRGLHSLDGDEEIVQGGLLHSALARVEKATQITRGALRRFVAEGELSSLRTYAQAAVGMRQAVARLGVMG
ncbi:MAG: hypothetical protein KatS3mg109_1774 [Pirellulaceae bacterium]|nr:MAG: hypothetical protein KatS3mg109_1774 [Pirellulaceae bacterium]